MLAEALQKIGLSEKEAKIYIALIGLGAQPVSVIARQASIRRTTAYSTLESLMKKGLVSSSTHCGITVFSGLDPRQLPDYLNQERNNQMKAFDDSFKQIEALLPAFISLENPGSTRPKVHFYEGEKGMQQAYEDTLSSSETILAYANIQDMHEGLPNFFPEYYKRRGEEKDIHIKAIFPDNELGRKRLALNENENRTALLIPSEYTFSPELNIYDDKVLISSWREKMALIIESKEIAELHKQIFRLAWEEAKNLQSTLFEKKS